MAIPSDPPRSPAILASLQQELYAIQKENLELKEAIAKMQTMLSTAAVFLKDYRADRRKTDATKTTRAIQLGKTKLAELKTRRKNNAVRIKAIQSLLKSKE